MKSSIGYMVLGIIAGFCLCLEGSLNSLLGRHVGVLKAAIAPFGTGLIAIVVVVLLLGKGKDIGLGLWLEAPWYSYLGGMWAVAFVCLMIYMIPKVGITAALSSVIAGQLIASLLFDAIGIFSLSKIPISLPRVAGAVLLLLGMRLIFVRTP